MKTDTQNKAIKGSFWGAFAFYSLITFEFFYMAGPFAMYFYSVYAPVLNFFNRFPAFAWLSRFFLPHAVRETSSLLINSLEVIGIVLAISGFLAFCIGACQVYYHKLTKKGIVTGGIYNRIRHPQYASFMVCSLGLLILWPRYIVAILFVTMVFFYYLLAKIEEAECERKFGQSYIDFKNRTAMFLPFRLSFLPQLPNQKGKRIVLIIFLYLVSVSAILTIAKGLNTKTIDSLYTTYSEHSVNVSLCRLSDEKIDEAVSIALTDEKVVEKLTCCNNTTNFINYILPTEWFAAEIPMNGVQRGRGHKSPADYDPNLYKVILTKADMLDGKAAAGKKILTSVYVREPIAEVWVDLSTHTVIKALDMPEEIMYQGVPVAVY
jgi:protein-S-isoprenylcysteine O-methyltransferase Ste14